MYNDSVRYGFMALAVVFLLVGVVGAVFFVLAACRGKQPVAGRIPWVAVTGSFFILIWSLSVVFQVIQSDSFDCALNVFFSQIWYGCGVL